MIHLYTKVKIPLLVKINKVCDLKSEGPITRVKKCKLTVINYCDRNDKRVNMNLITLNFSHTILRTSSTTISLYSLYNLLIHNNIMNYVI